MAYELVEQILAKHPDITATRSDTGEVRVTATDNAGVVRTMHVIPKREEVLISIPGVPETVGYTYMEVRFRPEGGIKVDVKNPNLSLRPLRVVEQSRLGLALVNALLETPINMRDPRWNPRVYDYGREGYLIFDHRRALELFSQPVRECIEHWAKPQGK